MSSFEHRKTIPQYWLNKSSDLRASAGVIWYGIHSKQSSSIVNELGLEEGFSLQVATSPIFRMLCGLSLELMYKAICVAKRFNFGKTHALVDLGELAGLFFTEQEKGILTILTESVIWDSKYPVPTERNKDAFENLPELYRKYLFDEVNASTSFKICRSNQALNWNSFDMLREAALQEYKGSRSFDDWDNE
jgi:hypothetical protein